MRGSIEKNLLEGEKIVYRARKHWIVFIYPVLWLFISFMFLQHVIPLQKLVIVPLFLTLFTGVNAAIHYFISDFVITDFRMFINVGWIQRVSIEAVLIDLASVKVKQGLWGRLLKYGTIEVCDSNNMCLSFDRVADPKKFERYAQTEIEKQLDLYPQMMSESSNE